MENQIIQIGNQITQIWAVLAGFSGLIFMNGVVAVVWFVKQASRIDTNKEIFKAYTDSQAKLFEYYVTSQDKKFEKLESTLCEYKTLQGTLSDLAVRLEERIKKEAS